MSTDNRAAYISGLRKLADLLERNADIPLPYASGTAAAPAHRITFYMLDASREAFVERARMFPGVLKKEVGNETFSLVGSLDGLHFDVVAYRDNVCERVVTGTRKVTRTIPDPDVEVPTVEVTETVEDVEWHCAPLLSEAGAS